MDTLALLILGAAGYVALASVVGRVLRALRKQQTVDPAPVQHDLSDARTRERLEAILNAACILGSANIRDGRVCEIVPAAALDSTVRSARLKVNSLRLRVDLGQMRGTDLYYASEITPDQFSYLMADLQIECVEALVGIAERVAEDRRRSRSLYKGLSDDDLTALIRVALARYWDDQAKGEFFSEASAFSDAARRGELDGSEHAKMLRTTILQLFEIKGAAE